MNYQRIKYDMAEKMWGSIAAQNSVKISYSVIVTDAMN